MWLSALLALACTLGGCAPGDPAKQAEAIRSIAAEAALLAHDAGEEGSSTETFVREHAEALERKLDEVRSVVDDQRLASVAADVAGQLARLAESPGDQRAAKTSERELERAARRAEELAK